MKDYQPAADLLKDRVILVTGAGEGIGRAVARRLAGHGATVILLDRAIRMLEQVYDEIEQAGGPRPAIYPMNLEGATPKDYTDLAQVLDTEFGRLDGLLHNAALFEGLTPIANYDIELWYRILQVNLNAPFLLTQALLGVLNRSADASVVFTTDRVGDEGRAKYLGRLRGRQGRRTADEAAGQRTGSQYADPGQQHRSGPGTYRTELAGLSGAQPGGMGQA